MRISRLYFKGKLTENATVNLDRDAIHYLSNVLRLKIGRKIKLFNSNDGEFLGTIATLEKNNLTVALNSKTSSMIEEPLKVHLVLGISKGDRMDYAIQKSVELGVVEITPMFSTYSDVKIKDKSRIEKKHHHWQRIARSACEQCGRLSIPSINEPVQFTDFIKNEFSDICIFLDPSGDRKLKRISCNGNVCLISGPEGGFAPSELEIARKKVQLVNLGPRILRAETAPVVALAILQSEFGDLG